MAILVTNMTDELKFSIASCNSRVFNLSKQQYTKELLYKCSVLFLQEHWLAGSQQPTVGSIVSGFGNTNIFVSQALRWVYHFMAVLHTGHCEYLGCG